MFAHATTAMRLRAAGLFPANASGASAAEFAIIAPVLLVMFSMMFTTGMFLRAHNTVSTYAREAARGVAMGYMTTAEAKQFAERNSQNDLRVAVTANVDPATKGDQNDQDVIVTVTITRDEMAKMTPFGNWVPDGVTSVAVMRSMTD